MANTRSKNKNGKFKRKRKDTHIGTIEKIYGKDYGVRSDMHLDSYLKKNGFGSLAELIKGGQK